MRTARASDTHHTDTHKLTRHSASWGCHTSRVSTCERTALRYSGPRPPPVAPPQHPRCQGHKGTNNNTPAGTHKQATGTGHATCEARAGMAAPPLAIPVALCDERPPQPAAVSAGLSKTPAGSGGRRGSSSSWPAMPMLMRRMQSQSV